MASVGVHITCRCILGLRVPVYRVAVGHAVYTFTLKQRWCTRVVRCTGGLSVG